MLQIALRNEIDSFLMYTAKWSGRWFNKPKFHLLLHLPDHIRRFGPAILFVTEAFEAFNAVIRAKSVHSNRQAPSHDIALAFAQGNRIRHLLSLGMFREKHSEGNPSLPERRYIGPAVQALVNSPGSIIQEYLGIPGEAGKARNGEHLSLVAVFPIRPRLNFMTGSCKKSENGLCLFRDTLTSKHIPHAALQIEHPFTSKVQEMKEMILLNGDKCPLHTHAIVRDVQNQSGAGPVFVGLVKEIICRHCPMGLHEFGQLTPDWVLVEVTNTGSISGHYHMPKLSYTRLHLTVELKVCFFFPHNYLC